MIKVFKMKKYRALLAIAALAFLPFKQVSTVESTQFWMKVKATDKFERSVIANTGAAIEIVKDDYVIVIGNLAEKNRLEKLGLLLASSTLANLSDFPGQDSNFHNYTELYAELQKINQTYPDITELKSIGKSVEGRDLWRLRISGDLSKASEMPGVIFMGGHHAREHVSVETPLLLARRLLEKYRSGDASIMALVDNRDIHVIPAVNPDGLEFDVSTGQYKYWRKNRHANGNGTYGVDLNRNYSFRWGTGGSSNDTSSDVYMGPRPFSEPETQAIKAYVESNVNITTLLSFHTFSQLILYPWGSTYDSIAVDRDKRVHEVMAKKMAEWNGYAPKQASSLYIASGDTTDWAYGEHKIISFTFELDPSQSAGQRGFYPGQAVIPAVVEKNWQPFLYLIRNADNPYQVLDQGGIGFP